MKAGFSITSMTFSIYNAELTLKEFSPVSQKFSVVEARWITIQLT